MVTGSAGVEAEVEVEIGVGDDSAVGAESVVSVEGVSVVGVEVEVESGGEVPVEVDVEVEAVVEVEFSGEVADGAEVSTSPTRYACPGRAPPLVSMTLPREGGRIPPGAFRDAKDTVAMLPLPEKGLVLITAIRIVPGNEAFGASIAPCVPETSPPAVTVGEVRIDESYERVRSIPPTPSMPVPCTA